MDFIRKSADFSTLERHVNAPLIRRSFTVAGECDAEIVVASTGFYVLYLNGRDITKGQLAPYISAPDDIVCCDRYSVRLDAGENVVALMLGNGMQNSVCGFVWDFDKAAWRGAPSVAFTVKGPGVCIDSGEGCRCSDSPVTFDDLRGGEDFDARLMISGWNEKGFDDSGWSEAEKAPVPRGRLKPCTAEPIVTERELTPVTVTCGHDGTLFDFGVNTSGVPRLRVRGERGTTVTLTCGELLRDGCLTQDNIKCDRDQRCQVIKYTLAGDDETEEYVPFFTYCGCRYVLASSDRPLDVLDISFLVRHSGLKRRGSFRCSDETVNRLQEMTERSTLSNFWYFPTDCPHREKNGWTGDAAVSAEQTLLSFDAVRSYREWLAHIREAQRADGALPGIVPTGGWGFKWGCGPAWDCVIVFLPYYSYLYDRDISVLEENADAVSKYLSYMHTRLNPDGTASYGLGDWCSPGRPSGDPKTPLAVTDTLVCADMCRKAAYIFSVLGQSGRCTAANELAKELLVSFRRAFLDDTGTRVRCMTQTAQALALSCGVFEDGDDYRAAYEALKLMIEENGGLHDCGIIGCRVIFRLLADNGDCDLALKMITDRRSPGFGSWIEAGATSLWESFPSSPAEILSMNHHFFGDISAFFYRCIAGIRMEEDGVTVSPCFPDSVDEAEAWHDTPHGRISVHWRREPDGSISIDSSLPDVLKKSDGCS